MKIDSIRIYAEVLEQGLDFKEYIIKSGINCPIFNVYTKKINGEIRSVDSLVDRIRKSKDVDVLIAAICGEAEFPLLMIEYSTAVPADDHKMQRSDVYYWGAMYKVPTMKIYPTNKGMNQDFGGGDKIEDLDEILLAHRVGGCFYPIQWKNIPGYDVLETKQNALSCIKENIEIQGIIAINLLNEGCYRSAARNIFALLESEHKRCANAFEGYFTKKKEYRKGHERANKIKDLLDKISIEWEQHSWEKINNYYKKIFANDKIEDICFRNGIVHGDYSDDAIDTNAVEVGKLVLLWLNLRLLADSLSILEDGYNSVLSYITGWAIYQES